MNTVVTSKEAILNVSRELVREQGWGALNIRAVAGACGVSIGSIYNYFESKSALTAAVVESIWYDIFHFPENESAFDSFAGCVGWAFDSMKKGDEKYPGFFTLHSMSFMGEEKSGGQKLMAQAWRHIKDRLYMVLISDRNVRPEVFDEAFTPEKFVEIIFSLIISALLQRNYDCSGILGMIGRVIY
ncbi:MAG: TetR/AcrR family transcriptional regulator [Lachnospiraceae bacterium]|nr:TetR/AcrR family transcriptional regulator [Lachnospiraceae bacterium]